MLDSPIEVRREFGVVRGIAPLAGVDGDFALEDTAVFGLGQIGLRLEEVVAAAILDTRAEDAAKPVARLTHQSWKKLIKRVVRVVIVLRRRDSCAEEQGGADEI